MLLSPSFENRASVVTGRHGCHTLAVDCTERQTARRVHPEARNLAKRFLASFDSLDGLLLLMVVVCSKAERQLPRRARLGQSFLKRQLLPYRSSHP
jgi:hypothetical protein